MGSRKGVFCILREWFSKQNKNKWQPYFLIVLGFQLCLVLTLVWILVLTRCIRAGGPVFICLFAFSDLWLLLLRLWLHPPSRYEASRVVGVTERSDDVRDERFLKLGQLRCCSIHEGADRKPQAGLLIALHTAWAINTKWYKLKGRTRTELQHYLILIGHLQTHSIK